MVGFRRRLRRRGWFHNFDLHLGQIEGSPVRPRFLTHLYRQRSQIKPGIRILPMLILRVIGFSDRRLGIDPVGKI